LRLFVGLLISSLGQVAKALTDCMNAFTPPSLNAAISTTNNYAGSGYVRILLPYPSLRAWRKSYLLNSNFHRRIDPVANLNDAKVYLFSGTGDGTVKPAVMNGRVEDSCPPPPKRSSFLLLACLLTNYLSQKIVLNQYYQNFVKQGSIEYVNTFNAAHTMPTDATGLNPCTQSYTPYIR